MIPPQDVKDEREKKTHNNIGLINDYLPILKTFLLQYCRITICANAVATDAVMAAAAADAGATLSQ